MLEKKGVPLVIVTGRSLSWGHFLLTHFSYLKEVIVEGGGAILSKKNAKEPRQISEEVLISNDEIKLLKNISEHLVKEIAGVKLSADSFGRLTDRAIELFDLASPELVKSVAEFLIKNKVNYSKSNVHLNFWVGEISKSIAVQKLVNEKNWDPQRLLYFGDSLNDQSMFRDFKHTVGVSNIDKVIKQMKQLPSMILEGPENEGPLGVLQFLNKYL